MENVMDVCVQENEKDRQQYKNSTYMLVLCWFQKSRI